MCCGVVVAFWTVLLGEKRLHVSVCVCVFICVFVCLLGRSQKHMMLLAQECVGPVWLVRDMYGFCAKR